MTAARVRWWAQPSVPVPACWCATFATAIASTATTVAVCLRLAADPIRTHEAIEAETGRAGLCLLAPSKTVGLRQRFSPTVES
ncbi:exported hypothetical protein [Mesorhizobium delmotii]|uniref:Secreted protein n=1 Tax=Mesorhizobium delmotii TaxID=1631247 RepID=A0A2P9AQU8_9HYPH|nr:exported hypothetical protein [Mesorhizobium delmotii]